MLSTRTMCLLVTPPLEVRPGRTLSCLGWRRNACWTASGIWVGVLGLKQMFTAGVGSPLDLKWCSHRSQTHSGTRRRPEKAVLANPLPQTLCSLPGQNASQGGSHVGTFTCSNNNASALGQSAVSHWDCSSGHRNWVWVLGTPTKNRLNGGKKISPRGVVFIYNLMRH